MATTTNYGWTTPDDTSLVKDGASAIRTLGSSVDTTTKALNPETTLGDLAYRSSTANVKTRLPLGTAGQFLAVNSGATAPEWVAAPASGGMTLLSTTTMSGAASYTLSSINQTYKRLMLVAIGLNRGSTSSTRFYPQDGTTDLSLGYTWWSGGNTTNTDSTYAVWPDDNNGYIATTKPLSCVWTIDNYASTTQVKVFTMYGAYYRTGAASIGFWVNGFINSNNAVNKITVAADPNFTAGTLYLYGVN